MSGRLAGILFIVALLALTAIVVPAYADEVYGVNQDFHRYDSDIVIHLLYVNITNEYMGNVYPSTAPQDTKWAHLVYQFENTGDHTEVGNIQYEYIDSQGRTYKFNPNLDEYSGVEVQAHTISDKRWNEVPIPKDAQLVKVHVFQGTNPSLLLANETYDLQGVPTATTTASATTAPVPTTYKFGCLSVLLPFAILGSLAIVGIYAKGRGIKK